MLAGHETCPTPRDVDGTGPAASIGNLVTGMAYDAAGNLYVGSAYETLRKLTPAGVVTTLAGGTQGHADGTGSAAQFTAPQGLALDAAGNLLVVDSGSAASFGQPKEASINAAGNLYVSDNNRTAIRKVTPAGVVTTVAVTAYFTTQTGQQPPAGAVRLPALQSNTCYIANSAGVVVLPVNCALETIGP